MPLARRILIRRVWRRRRRPRRRWIVHRMRRQPATPSRRRKTTVPKRLSSAGCTAWSPAARSRRVAPHIALSHPSGEAEIGFLLARTGAVSDVHVIRSSGSALLDRQALAIVSGGHYPAIPDDVYPGAATHAFSVPVAFAPAGGADDL